MPMATDGMDIAALATRLSQIERRLQLIETRLEITEDTPVAEPSPEDVELREEDLENRIGENWLPRIGIMVLVIGVAFLLTFPYRDLPSLLPGLFGFLVAGGALALSWRWRDTLPQISRDIQGGALVLLYFTALRLHFFSADPPVTSRTIELCILILIVGFTTITGLRSRSFFQLAIGVVTGCITALIGGEPWFVVPVTAVVALATVGIAHRWKRPSILLFATVLIYLTHLLWVLNDPILGHELMLIASSPWIALPILLYAVILATGTFLRADPTGEEGIVIANSSVNALGAGGLYLFVTILRSGDALVLHHVLASALFLGIAIAFWKKEESRYSTFVYAMLGYMAMSTAMIAQFTRPDYFTWLAWQSLVVVSTAVWFRSQFIVIANFAIYLILFVAYATVVDTVLVVSLSFGIVAVASARVLNWQKERLALKTEMMRNAYLACAFFIFPFALYHALPQAYVSISWIVAALFYYAMSILVKSRKYRWMAFLTFLLTIGRVLLVDSVSLEPTYRIISFLVLGTVLVLISLKYAKQKARGTPPATGH
jgi:hypothetical protein